MHRARLPHGDPVTRAPALAAVTAASIGIARAEPPPPAEPARAPRLVLTHEPPPRHLRMRPRAAQAPAPDTPVRARTPMPAAPSARGTHLAPIDGLDGLRDVRQPVSFSLNLGYQVDNARPTGERSLDGHAVAEGNDWRALRAYGFGEAFVSTRGLGLPSLETYFAARFQAARSLELDHVDPGDPELRAPRVAPPIATWFERTGFELRTGWAEVKDFLPERWGLRRLRVRAGDQFVYGPWILHLSGWNVAYEGDTIHASVYGGQRRADYARDLDASRPLALGGSWRFDLRGLTARVPIVLTGELLRLRASEVAGQPETSSSMVQLDWRPRRDVAVFGVLRTLDGEIANERVEVRTRYKDVTNFVFDVMRRRGSDWRWDPTLVARPEAGAIDSMEAKRYLDLGPVEPQLIASARAGTLIAENLDVYARVAGAIALEDGRLAVAQAPSTYNASYIEAAGAVEIRLRRQVAFGASALARTIRREELDAAQLINDVMGQAEDLPRTTVIGDDGFVEGGASLRLTLGARRFSALVELYSRRTDYGEVYRDRESPLPAYDVRGGGRFTVDAWIGNRIRLFASYDLSSSLASAPELSGYKSLRMMMSGVY